MSQSLRRGNTSRSNMGFSLIELIIVIAIMAVLAGFMVPMYISYVERARRTKYLTSAGEFKKSFEVALTDAGTQGLTHDGSSFHMDFNGNVQNASAPFIAEVKSILDNSFSIAPNQMEVTVDFADNVTPSFYKITFSDGSRYYEYVYSESNSFAGHSDYTAADTPNWYIKIY